MAYQHGPLNSHKNAIVTVSPTTPLYLPAIPQRSSYPISTSKSLRAENSRLRVTRARLTTVLNEMTAMVKNQRARRELAEDETLRERVLARTA